ncbi:hypothetical protein A2127_02060 [Candidatus Jorgensenbacteria bacterium GWC1_48_12]|uniref:Uncharacterized protein n=1 Tax=Candidatus Jorgensenbacteria bacterium GWC1_48_12 TaxID=1798469 RepID=A0A1F6BPM3_9BACT|nr:MAG: hypothetical protein A2127_02060 [Candidatus Jorgensenbacteria bacterium GWC1_48_12]
MRKKINKKLAKELLEMMRTDQEMWLQFIAGKEKLDARLDRKHTWRLKKIIKKHGWPIKSLVGRRASHAAWLLTQHSPDLKFQKKVLSILNDIYKKSGKEINPAHTAYLTDRILIKENKKQIFGTQLRKNKSGTFEPFPTQNVKDVDKKRKMHGLLSLEKYVKEHERAINQWKKIENQPAKIR